MNINNRTFRIIECLHDNGWMMIRSRTFNLQPGYCNTSWSSWPFTTIAATLETLFFGRLIVIPTSKRRLLWLPNHLCFGFAWNGYLRQRNPRGETPNSPLPRPVKWLPTRHLHHTEAASQQGSDEITRINLTWSLPNISWPVNLPPNHPRNTGLMKNPYENHRFPLLKEPFFCHYFWGWGWYVWGGDRLTSHEIWVVWSHNSNESCCKFWQKNTGNVDED